MSSAIEQLVTMKEASQILRVSDQVLRMRIKEGALRCVRERGKVLFTREQINEYITSRSITGAEAVQDKRRPKSE